MENEFSIRRIYAPLLETISNFKLINTSTIEVVFSSLTTFNSTISNTEITNNSDLISLDFPQLQTINMDRRFIIQDNNAITSIEWNALQTLTYDGVSNPNLDIYENNNLVEVNFNSLISMDSGFRIYRNENLKRIELNALVNAHRQFFIENNNNLLSIIAPQLFSVGDYLFQGESLHVWGNTQLSSVDFSSLLKVYSRLNVNYNNSLDTSTAFPCEMFVFYNDGFDCSQGEVNVTSNQNDIYCFQDLSLRVDSDLTTTPIYAITSTDAESGGVITSNSFVKMQAKGVCWSSSPSPTIADTFSENGNWNADYGSFIYNLTPNTTYYVRAYIEDCNGVYYGNEISFTSLP